MAHQQRQVTPIRSSRTSRKLWLHESREHREQRLQDRRESERLRRQQENVEQHQERLQARHKSECLRRQQESFGQHQRRLQARWKQSQQKSLEQRHTKQARIKSFKETTRECWTALRKIICILMINFFSYLLKFRKASMGASRLCQWWVQSMPKSLQFLI